MKKALFIYSPYAGEQEILENLDYIAQQYQSRGILLTWFRYTDTDNIADAISHVDNSYSHLLIAGGDGTINRVVSEMKRQQLDLPIATIPAGTANDFATMLGFSASIKKAVGQILDGEVSEVDLGKANSSFFVNILSAGLLTEVSQKTPTILKNTLGKLAYYVSSVQELPKFRKIHIKLFNETLYFEDNILLMLVMNGKTAGNLRIAHFSNVQDGLLDILLIKGDNIGDSIQMILHFLSGSKQKYPKGVVHFKARSVRVETEGSVTFDVDGERGPIEPLDIECIEKGLKVITPIKKKKL